MDPSLVFFVYVLLSYVKNPRKGKRTAGSGAGGLGREYAL
jgi:hypothetical protein